MKDLEKKKFEKQACTVMREAKIRIGEIFAELDIPEEMAVTILGTLIAKYCYVCEYDIDTINFLNKQAYDSYKHSYEKATQLIKKRLNNE
jgi:hypothetical protein